ncbi:MAG TPA: S8 family serine peptidase, partial [Acidimicrobiales bacterium]|nr:S8 family serine peptidase [Acidimicrobiales bacterium]
MPRHRSLRHIVAAFLTAVGLAGGALVNGPATADLLDPDPPANVIVQLWDGNDGLVRNLIGTLAGTITEDLPVINGFAATVPSSEVATLIQASGVRAVTPDAPVVVQEAMADGGAPSVHKDVIGSTAANASGMRGAGATVAVLDTGVSSVSRLADRLVRVRTGLLSTESCLNLSSERDCHDNYGHGTFVAGMVNDVAPDAGILSVKLAGRDGSMNVSRLLKGIGWVISNKDTYGVKVMNLSVRTYSPLSYRVDPVNLAVERAWAAGISVVVSAGNQGPAEATIAKPGDDPWVITVGSTDDQGTVGLEDDVVSSFSARGPSVDGIQKPDVVLPGRSLVGLRSPGSEADVRFPNFVDAERRRGSGTSFSAPLVAGAAAVMHAADPTATNDRVKFALTATARAIPGASASAAGAGTIDLPNALAAPAGVANDHRFHPLLWPGWTASLADVVGSVFESQWQSGVWDGANWQGANWQGANWQGANWQGANWQGANWQGANWQGA